MKACAAIAKYKWYQPQEGKGIGLPARGSAGGSVTPAGTGRCQYQDTQVIPEVDDPRHVHVWAELTALGCLGSQGGGHGGGTWPVHLSLSEGAGGFGTAVRARILLEMIIQLSW